MHDTIGLLRDLVAINSVNPSVAAGGAGEGAIAERIAMEMRGWGIDVVVTDAAPGRPNVFGVVDGHRSGPCLMFCGHSDTVGVEGMAAPFDPVVRDGKLFGRGAQDMKGGLAAMLGAARTLAASRATFAGRILVAVVVDEEYASLGADATVKDWTADAAIVTEPTDLAIGIGHKGFEWVDIETEGVAAHGSRPDDGVDAIVMMGRVLAELDALEGRFIAGAPHPLLGRPSLHASIIRGGRELSTYPDRCTLSVERRTVSGEARQILLSEANALLDELRTRDRRFRATARPLFDRSPYLTPEGHALPQLLCEAMKGVGAIGPRTTGSGETGPGKTSPGKISTVSFWTDAAILGGAGIPSVIFGPGGAGLHSIEEYVHIDDVLTCQDALVETARRYCA